MIVVDIEASGVDMNGCGIWQIGALDLEDSSNTFLEEARLNDEDILNLDSKGKKTSPEELFGKTEGDLRDKEKQSEKELLVHFFNWCKKIKNNTLVAHNPQFDFAFIQLKAYKYNLKLPFDYKCFDTHSMAQMKYLGLKGELLMKTNDFGNIVSDLGLRNILSFAGMKDNRKEHNALEDAKLTAEAFFRLVYGKNLLGEYANLEIPEYLVKSEEKK